VLFKGVSNIFPSGRYHSWSVSDRNLPDCLKILARDTNGTIMALRHSEFPITGIQFHPESVLTPDGKKIMENWAGTIIY
jgi:anthranilate synthase component 2